MPNGVARNSSSIDYWTPSTEGGTSRCRRSWRRSNVPRSAARRRRPRPEPGGSGNDGASGDHTRHELVADRRLSQAHRRGRRPQRYLRRSDRGAGAGQGHGTAVARARHRFELPRRPVREQLQLRLPQHARMDVADDAAAHREQPAGGIRTAVRRRRDRSGVPRTRGATAASSIRCSTTSIAAADRAGDRAVVEEWVDSVRG